MSSWAKSGASRSARSMQRSGGGPDARRPGRRRERPLEEAIQRLQGERPRIALGGCEAVQDRQRHRLGSLTAIGERAGEGRHRRVAVPGQEPPKLELGMDPHIQAAVQLERQALTMDRGRVAVLGVGDRTAPRAPGGMSRLPERRCVRRHDLARGSLQPTCSRLHERLGEVRIEERVEQDALFVAPSPLPTQAGDARPRRVAVGPVGGRKGQRERVELGVGFRVIHPDQGEITFPCADTARRRHR